MEPSQFQVNEAWIAFQVNDAPIQTRRDGAFDCLALMDAASCYVLGFVMFRAGEPEPSELETRRLLETAWAQKEEFPAMLFVPTGRFQNILPAEAKRRGISVVPVRESHLLAFIGEARRSFKEYFPGAGANSDA